MRLKRLELAGFKSFVDPTKIELGEGVTAIVGPNGSGKSNIIDALRWVLGEHSAKHLRGGVMDDLIFQGSDTRAPVAICDVELTFSIAQGELPSPYHEMDEIRIRRRMTREGGSDAFINGKMVRLKDVVDLFLDTGISTRAYAIIEQGAIARMVTAKPEERRTIFEEAAGVMKYRSRRREAERRMKDTRQNLERAVDLLEEVRSQCRSLKQQASRAERFRKMQDEFTRMQSVSLGLRYRSMQEKFAAIEAQLQEARQAEAASQAALNAAEKQVVEVRDKLGAHETEAQKVQDRLRQAEQQRAGLQQQAERQAGERRLLAERKVALQQRLEEAEKTLARLTGDIEEAEKHLAEQDDAELQASKRDAAEALDTAERQYHQQVKLRDEKLADYERLRQSGAQAEQQKQKAEASLARLAERHTQLENKQQGLKQLLAENAELAKQADQQMHAAVAANDSAAEELEQAQAKLDRCRTKRESASEAMASQEDALRELRGVVQELRGRTRNQDVPEELRDAMRARGAVWMDESLDVPKGLEAAVAAALRGRSADVRIPVNPDLTGWQGLLKKSADAPVALFTGQAADSASVDTSLAHAMNMADKHPLYDVFAQVALVDDIIEAHGASQCCVSRDGWRYEADGWVIPPAGNRTASRLTVQRKLRDNEAMLEKLEASVVTVQQQFAAAEQALEQQQQVWQQAHLAATRAESDVHAARAAVERLQTEGMALAERQQRISADLQETEQERSHWTEQIDQAGEIDQDKLQAAHQALELQNAEVAQAEQTRNQNRNQLAHAEQTLALFAQARETMQRDQMRLLAEQERVRQQMLQDEQRLQEADHALTEAARQEGLDQELSEAARSVDEAHQQLNSVRQQGHALQQQTHEVERSERLARQQHQQVSERRQASEVSQAQEAARLQDLNDEIMQRCQLSPDALLQKIDMMEELDDAEAILNRSRELEDRIGRFGPVNLLAIDEYEQASERETFLAEQAADLESSLVTLTDTITRIDRTTRQRFREVFDQTNAIFQKTFPTLFGGGRAELRLDSDDILTAGVEVIAQPPGKRLQDVTLLSGGEKALTAVALVFSIFQIKPAPFCVLDEVDAPLDDANVGRFGDMVRELAGRVQFLSITHNRITMQQADRLVGVSMPEPGVSRIVSVHLEAVPH